MYRCFLYPCLVLDLSKLTAFTDDESYFFVQEKHCGRRGKLLKFSFYTTEFWVCKTWNSWIKGQRLDDVKDLPIHDC